MARVNEHVCYALAGMGLGFLVAKYGITWYASSPRRTREETAPREQSLKSRLAVETPITDAVSDVPICTPVRTVLLLFAMEEEAAPFITTHGWTHIPNNPFGPLPFESYTGYCGDMKVYLTWAGTDKRFKVNNVATTAATLSCYASLQAFSGIDVIISAGTAGGFSSAGGEIADVYLSSKCVFHSRRIQGVVGYEEYGFGHFRNAPLELLADATGCKVGVVSTSDSLDHTPKDLQIMRNEGASVKEMEGAATAWVAQQLSVPFFCVKSITDIVDGGTPSHIEFERNLKASSDMLQLKLSLILRKMAGKALSAWSS